MRIVLLLAWIVLTLLVVGPVVAQDGGEEPGLNTGEAAAPSGLDELATRLAPLLVGAALIERILEFLFTWVERAVVDANNFLHSLAIRLTGLLQVDLKRAWKELNELKALVLAHQLNRDLKQVANPASVDPAEWPLELIEVRLLEAQQTFARGELMLRNALSSDVYIARKKIVAVWLSVLMGLALAFTSQLRLFQPLGIEVAGWFKDPFDWIDLVLAGVLMGLGTEWVHQVIGVLIQGKGLLGRAAGGSLDADQVRALAQVAIEKEFQGQLNSLRDELLGKIGGQSSAPASPDTGEAAPSAEGMVPVAVPVAVHAAAIAPQPPEMPAEAAPPAHQPDDTPPVEALRARLEEIDAMTENPPPVEALEETLEQIQPPDEMPDGVNENWTAAPAAVLSLPEDAIPLQDVTVRGRSGGATVYRAPDTGSTPLGTLAGGQALPVSGAIFGAQTWLQTVWNGEEGWIVGEQTDFARSPDYAQVVDAWYESDAVLGLRRGLVRDLLRVSSASQDRLAQVDQLRGAALREQEDQLTRQTPPPEYARFWQMREQLGLPDPFNYLPVLSVPPGRIEQMEINGFGPTTFAFHNWEIFYENTRGLHNGIDYIVPEGSPLIAVSDGVIVDFDFMPDPAERTLALRPYLPPSVRSADGSRVLSNLIVGYGHLTGESESAIVRVGDEVRAGQVIGTSGWPVVSFGRQVSVQHNNPHLHLETHLATDGRDSLGSRHPVNPLLFWTPSLIALHARLAAHGAQSPYPNGGQPFGRLGFFSIGAFSYEPDTPVWRHTPTGRQVWPEGVYDLGMLLDWLRSFEPYTPPSA
ncbi:MAG: peptidoglycan DD-metalloendopeptidase family protein [Chloroflexi bacterium]|nr:peptidoglycan DD-metalloendopeptidase family protein [Chloroflexota bacterium]